MPQLARTGGMTAATRQPWIHSPRADGLLILLPPLVATAVAAMVARGSTNNVPVWAWALLIVGVDVAHVYGTLFRTYLRPSTIRQRPALYALAPLLGWIAGVLLYSAGRLAFWRALAYLATFHFVRQQYGFMRIYARRERTVSNIDRTVDAAAIYAATLYPLIYWHAHLPRRFQWFVSGDFIALPAVCAPIAGAAFLAILAAYAAKELRLLFAQRLINVPKNLLLLGTLVSWYVGIVVLNGDLPFTVTNVVSHGVPYLALVWLLGHDEVLHSGAPSSPRRLGVRAFFTTAGIPLFCLVLIGLAYIEEGLWDGMVWRDHASLFPLFQTLSVVNDRATLTWLVPLLALPQITHYVLDGFIWRLHGAGEGSQAVAFTRDVQG